MEEARRSHTSAREAARLERKKAQAAALGEKAAAAEAGEDLERKQAWDYSIEDNDKWEKKLKRKRARGDFAFTGQCNHLLSFIRLTQRPPCRL